MVSESYPIKNVMFCREGWSERHAMYLCSSALAERLSEMCVLLGIVYGVLCAIVGCWMMLRVDEWPDEGPGPLPGPRLWQLTNLAVSNKQWPIVGRRNFQNMARIMGRRILGTHHYGRWWLDRSEKLWMPNVLSPFHKNAWQTFPASTAL